MALLSTALAGRGWIGINGLKTVIKGGLYGMGARMTRFRLLCWCRNKGHIKCYEALYVGRLGIWVFHICRV